MADPVETAKDVSMAFLSASALLLTLVLGFISPSLPKIMPVRVYVVVSTFSLYVSACISAYALWKLVELPVNTRRLPKQIVKYYALLFLFFLIGVALIAAAICLLIVYPAVFGS